MYHLNRKRMEEGDFKKFIHVDNKGKGRSFLEKMNRPLEK